MQQENSTQEDPVLQQMSSPKQAHPPEIIDGIKVYPPSFMPAKSTLHVQKTGLIALGNLQIEVLHLVLFLIISFFLFFSIWKRPNLR